MIKKTTFIRTLNRSCLESPCNYDFVLHPDAPPFRPYTESLSQTVRGCQIAIPVPFAVAQSVTVNSSGQFAPFTISAGCVRAGRTMALGTRRPEADPARSGNGDLGVEPSAVM